MMASPTSTTSWYESPDPKFRNSMEHMYLRFEQQGITYLTDSVKFETIIYRCSLYASSSLDDSRRFVRDRHVPFKYMHVQCHTKKSQNKREKEEKLKLLAALCEADAAATVRFAGLPPELREQVYHYYLFDITVRHAHTPSRLLARLERVPPRFRQEADSVLKRAPYPTLPEPWEEASPFHARWEYRGRRHNFLGIERHVGCS